MCVIDDLEHCPVWRETERKARKEHKCSCCRRRIGPGETYLDHFSVFDGGPHREKMCAECVADRRDFADAHGGVLCNPSYFPRMLADCIGDDEDGETRRWEEMEQRIYSRRKSKAN